MRWIDKAKDVARSYKSNRKELELLQQAQESGLKSANIASMRSGRISKPVEAAVLRNLSSERQAYLQCAVFAVDYALTKVRDKPNGDVTIKIFEMVYRDNTHKLFAAATELHISERTARRYSQFMLRTIACEMGFIQLF